MTANLITLVGAGITTVLLAAVLVIELLDFEFSAIVGLPVEVIVGAGIATAAVVYATLWNRDRDAPG